MLQGKEDDKSFKEASEYTFKFPGKHDKQSFIRFLSNGKMKDYLSSDVNKNKFAGKGISTLRECLYKMIIKIKRRKKTISDLYNRANNLLGNHHNYVDTSMNRYFVDRFNKKLEDRGNKEHISNQIKDLVNKFSGRRRNNYNRSWGYTCFCHAITKLLGIKSYNI